MKAALRSLSSADIDVETYVPDDPATDGVWIRLIVGPADGPGDESFDVLVCTPNWLRNVVAEEGPQIGRHRLIVDPFDLTVARDFLRRQVESVEAPDWPTLAEKLGRLGYWEFEDYQP